MSTEEVTISLGTFTCPDCGHQHKVRRSLEQAREHAAILLAAVAGLRPVWIPYDRRAGSDG